jgi:hypothetical protein
MRIVLADAATVLVKVRFVRQVSLLVPVNRNVLVPVMAALTHVHP